MPIIKTPKAPPPPARKLVKPKSTAEILDCSLRQVYYLEERQEIEFVRDGRAAYVVAESLDAYIARLRAKAAVARQKETAEKPAKTAHTA